jgi:uncharacterized protein (DUF1800 family)
MQLFTIGLWKLNPDGTQQMEGSGNPIPTYSNTDVVGIAKVFTALSWNMPGNTSNQAWSGYGAAYAGPRLWSRPFAHGCLSHAPLGCRKRLSGNHIAAGSSSPTADLKIVLDALFNHPNRTRRPNDTPSC